MSPGERVTMAFSYGIAWFVFPFIGVVVWGTVISQEILGRGWLFIDMVIILLVALTRATVGLVVAIKRLRAAVARSQGRTRKSRAVRSPQN